MLLENWAVRCRNKARNKPAVVYSIVVFVSCVAIAYLFLHVMSTAMTNKPIGIQKVPRVRVDLPTTMMGSQNQASIKQHEVVQPGSPLLSIDRLVLEVVLVFVDASVRRQSWRRTLWWREQG